MKGSLPDKKGLHGRVQSPLALDLLTEEKIVAQISAEYGAHPNVVRD